MNDTLKIVEAIQPVLNDFDVQLYDIKIVNSGKNKILQIAIMNVDGSMDIDTCADVSEKISIILDEQELINFEYFLEVCSPGAERILKTKFDVENVIEKHIYTKFKHLVNNKLIEVTGDLISFKDDELTVSYRDKAVTRKVSFKWDDIDLIRLAVKF